MTAPSITFSRLFGALPSTARGHSTPISADSRGQRIAYASGKSIFVRSIDNPADCQEYTGHTAPTTVARFSPSGFRIASGDSSGMLKVWEPGNIDKTKGEYAIISGRLNDIAWDGESQRLIAVGAGKEQFGRCITADSGNSVGEIIGHSKDINAVAMKPQRPFRAATVGDDSSMVFYHGAPYKFQQKSSEHKGFVLGAAYSPDGSILVTVGADKKIQFYDGKTGDSTKQIGENVHKGSIFAISFNQDGSKFATASADQTVVLWDTAEGVPIQTWKLGEGVSVKDHQVGVVIPHGRSDGLIISINLDGELTYLKEGSDQPLKVVQGHAKAITALALGSDKNGTDLWSGDFDGRICHWDVRTGIAVTVDGPSHTTRVAQIAGSQGKIFSAGWDDVLRTADESAKTFLGSASSLSSQPVSLAESHGRIYVATTSGLVVYEGDKILHENPLAFTPAAVAATGSTLAIAGGSEQNQFQLYKVESDGKITQDGHVSNPTGTVTALAFSKDGSHLAAGNSVGKIYVYDTSSREVVADRWSAHTARVTSIAWDESGKYAVSGSLDTNIFVWCLEKKLQGKRIKAPNAHKDGVSGVTWIGSNSVASTGGDATIKVWKLKDLP